MFEYNKSSSTTGSTIAIADDVTASIPEGKIGRKNNIHGSKNIGVMCLYAYVKDTEGNVVGIWQDLKVEK